MLTITSSLAGTLAVPLEGTAITGISVSPPSVDFGTVSPGSSTPTTLTIENTDPINSVTLTPPFAITGSDAGSFIVGAPGTTFLGGSDTTPLVGDVPAGDTRSEERDAAGHERARADRSQSR